MQFRLLNPKENSKLQDEDIGHWAIRDQNLRSIHGLRVEMRTHDEKEKNIHLAIIIADFIVHDSCVNGNSINECKRMNRETASEPGEIRFQNIVGMGLDFSSMIRLFEKDSEDKLWEKIVFDTAEKIFNTQSQEQFNDIHSEFCDWGSKNVFLAEKTRNGRMIKKRKLASYGQVAKTLDVTLKVMVYYCHLPNYETSKRLVKWLHAAVDTQMMGMLADEYPEEIQPRPTKIEEVDKAKYLAIQEIVSRFISEKHEGKLLPVEFDDIYWYKLNY